MKPAQRFFMRHSIIFADKARACFSRMFSDRKIYLQNCKTSQRSFDHMTPEAVIENPTTVFARELIISFLLNKSGDDNTALLLIDGTYMYIYIYL